MLNITRVLSPCGVPLVGVNQGRLGFMTDIARDDMLTCMDDLLDGHFSPENRMLLAAEVTREQLYLQLHAELPYASAVETESFKERPDGSVEIHQQIMVERPTQRAIVLGKGGQQIKQIGARARAQLTELLDRPVHLYLHVKVDERWDERREVYEGMGLDWSD